MSVKLLSLDPSSSVVGYALFIDGKLHDAGKLTPDKASASALARVISLRQQLVEMLYFEQPDVIIIEAMVEKQYTRNAGRVTALALCGWAMGVAFGTCITWAACGNTTSCTAVHAVGNQEWTRGRRKDEAKTLTAAEFPQYNPKDDKGGDVADAISMGLWWLAAQKAGETWTK
jgi:hypothetical protein